jgi:sugar diacid utilization regulator
VPEEGNGALDSDSPASLGTLHKPSAGAVLDRLELRADAIARRMALATRAEVEEYAAVSDPSFAREVLAHAEQHVRAFVVAGRAGRPPAGDGLDFVRERGAQRARELMPLDALLEAYLIGQRTVWEAIVEAAGDSAEGMRTAQALTALTFRYTHAINLAVAEAYLRESTALASEAERGRRDLLDHLLSGREPGPEEARRAEALGVRPTGAHAVVVAVATDDEGAEPARLIVRALMRQEPLRAFVVARHREVVAILPVYVRRGPRELRAAIARVAAVLARTHGVALRAGVSSTCAGLSELARGYGEARRALEHAGAAAPAVALEEIRLLDYLTAAADDTARRLVPPGADDLRRADGRGGGALSATLRAYADCDLNVARTAERLFVHPNTVHYRLRRVKELSGRDPRRLAELVELLTALRLLERAER